MKEIVFIQRIWFTTAGAFECELLVKGQKEPVRNVDAVLVHENEVSVRVTPEYSECIGNKYSIK